MNKRLSLRIGKRKSEVLSEEEEAVGLMASSRITNGSSNLDSDNKPGSSQNFVLTNPPEPTLIRMNKESVEAFRKQFIDFNKLVPSAKHPWEYMPKWHGFITILQGWGT